MSEILTREELERLILDNCDSAGCCTNSGGGVNYGPCTRCAVLLAHDAALRARVAELERVIEEAPHGLNASHVRCRADLSPRFTCDCWKSKAKVSG